MKTTRREFAKGLAVGVVALFLGKPCDVWPKEQKPQALKTTTGPIADAPIFTTNSHTAKIWAKRWWMETSCEYDLHAFAEPHT